MATQKWKLLGTLIVSLIWTSSWAPAQSQERFKFAEPHLGTIVEITLYASEDTVANDAAKAAFGRVKELDQIFSDYKTDSEALRLSASAGSGQAVKVSDELFHVIKQAVEVSEKSDGAFDVTVGPLVQLWRRARKQKVLPNDDEIRQAKELVGWKLLKLDEATQSVELKRQGMRLDFGGMAKGFIAQDVSRLLREKGVQQTLVAVAGDIVAGDAPSNTTGWKVGVAPLDRPNGAVSRLLLLKNCAISTSGDAFQFVEINSVRYSHIVDPQTGLGLTQRSSVTIVAADGTTADALATAVCVLGSEKGLKLIQGLDRVEALIVQATDEGPRVIESKSFRTYEAKSCATE
jgi:thiamine biosynthesis lipoprotein